jgi:hypothetical protein
MTKYKVAVRLTRHYLVELEIEATNADQASHVAENRVLTDATLHATEVGEPSADTLRVQPINNGGK